MMLWGLLLMTALIMKCWPETRFARDLHRTMIAQPLVFVSRIRRAHLVFLIVGFGVIYSCAMAGMPHLGIVAAMDVSLYVDALITVSTVAALNRSRAAWTVMFAWMPRLHRSAPRPRARRTARPARTGAVNDDDGHGRFVGAWALAA